MPSSKAVSMGVVLTNGTNFISLYFRSEKNDNNNEVIDKFYWVQSNASGVPTSGRNNALNGYFSSQSAAIDDKPDGYGDLPPEDSFRNEKILSYMNMFPFDSDGDLGEYANGVSRAKSEYTEIVAAGANCIVVPITWDAVFATKAEQDTNDSSKWSAHDELVNHALSLGVKVSLRIIANKDDGPHNDIDITNTSGFYGLSKNSKDQLGNVSRIDGGIGHVSLAYADGVSQVLDFVKKAIVRYQGILGNKFRWFSVVLSSQNEIGYNYENQYYFGPKYPALFDYSTYSKEGFRAFLASNSKYNNNISALNSAWGTTFGTFDAVTPPGEGLSGTTEQLTAILATNAGQDWYEWNDKLVISFLNSVEALIPANSITAKMATETGSDTDDKALIRLTANINRWITCGSLHKTQLGVISRDTSFAHTVDYLRHYAQNGGTLGSEFSTSDMVKQQYITDPTTMENTLVELALSSRKYAGANEFMLISSKQQGYFNVAVNAARRMKVILETVSLDIPANTPTVQWSLSQALRGGANYMRTLWANNGGSATSRVNMVQVDGIPIPPSSTCVFPYQIYPIQNFCLSSGSIRASTYNHNFESVKNTHWLALVPTHSNSYVEGQLSLCDYTITGISDGIVYVKNTQQVGHQVTYSSSQDNNHPRYYADNPVYFNDAVFVLPLNQSYRIDFTCKSSHAISATVETLDINPAHDSTLDYRRKLSTAGTPTGSFTFNPATAGTNFIRQIKFNCNRLNSTDTDANI